jgi:hypothetical protein
MLAMDDAKLPPPMPATAATASSVPRDTPGSSTDSISSSGTTSARAVMTVQLRPPNFAMAKV